MKTTAAAVVAEAPKRLQITGRGVRFMLWRKRCWTVTVKLFTPSSVSTSRNQARFGEGALLYWDLRGMVLLWINDSITCYNQVVNIKDYLKKYLMWSAETTCQVLDITKLSGDKQVFILCDVILCDVTDLKDE